MATRTSNTELYGHTKKDGTLYDPKGLTEEAFDALIESIALGAPIRMAAQAAGISDWTVHRWLREAAVLEAKGVTSEQDIRVRFAIELDRARAQRAIEALERIRDAAKNPQNWTAAAWYLERTYPEHYGKQDRKAIDWRDEMRKLNVDPDQLLQAMVKEAVKQHAGADTEDGDDVIEGVAVPSRQIP